MADTLISPYFIPKNSMQAAKKTFLFLVIVASIGLVALGAKMNAENGWISTFVAIGSHEEGEYYITPSSPTINSGEDVTFKSYTQSSTGSVEVKSDWTVTEVKESSSLPTAYAMSMSALDSLSATQAQHLSITQIIQQNPCRVLTSFVEEDNNFAFLPTAHAMAIDNISAALALRPLRGNLIIEKCEKIAELHIMATNIEGKFKVTATNKDGETATATLKVKKKSIPVPFKDPVPEWAADAAAILNKTGIMTGYSDGNFGSSDPVTRGQLAVLLSRTMKEVMGVDNTEALQAQSCNRYSDLVDPAHYAYLAVCEGSYLNWYDGLGITIGGAFEPDKVLTRKEVAQILYNSVAKIVIANSAELRVLTDADLISKTDAYSDMNNNAPGAVAIGALNVMGVITGTFNQNANAYEFFPDRTLNRGETAAILWRLIQAIDRFW